MSPRAGHQEVHAHPSRPVVDHLLHPPLAEREELGEDADVLLGGVDREALDGLVHLAVQLAGDDLRLPDGQLEALAAHQLDEHRELQLAATLHLPRVGPLGRRRRGARRCRQLLVEPLLDHRRGELRAVLARPAVTS